MKKKSPPMGRPVKYQGGAKLRAVKVPLNDEQFERVKSTDPLQRAAVLLKLCDEIDSVKRCPICGRVDDNHLFDKKHKEMSK